MAPEQWQGGECSTATDTWALGMVLYELVTGRHPWAGCTLAEMCLATCDPGLAVRLPKRHRSRWPELAQLIERCLSRRPEDRPPIDSIVAAIAKLVGTGGTRRTGGQGPLALTVGVVAFSWTAATAAFPLAVVIAVLGQGIGAVLGGCSWIGVTLPLHRQPWALVNQPSMAFSAQAVALGYWLGSTALPLLVAAVGPKLLPRFRSLAGELLAVHICWACAAVGGGWLPLLDGDDGHVALCLSLFGLPAALVWIIPAAAVAAGMVPAARLMGLRPSQPSLPGRAMRFLNVLAHLGVPIAI
jgi:hypothetical protein